MNFWERILYGMRQSRLGLTRLLQPEDPDTTAAFGISFIALGAKLAKADGRVTRDEVAAFREIFEIAPEDETRAAQVFNLCRQDISGYEQHAKRIGQLIEGNERAASIRSDLMEGLFHIAMADGVYDPAEHAFLERVSDLIGLNHNEFSAIHARHVPDAWDPRRALGLPPYAGEKEARAARRRIAREAHPDALRARGVPDEMVRVSEERLRTANRALEDILDESTPDIIP